MKSRAIAAEQRTCDFRLLDKELVAGLLLPRIWACRAVTFEVEWGVCGIKRGV